MTEIFTPPMSMTDVERIVNIVEGRLKIHLPNLERTSVADGSIILLHNPANGKTVKLYEQFIPATHGAAGYRIWTLEAIPELLRYLIGGTEVKQ